VRLVGLGPRRARIAYSIAAATSLSDAELQELAPLLHDRMIEAPLYALEAAGQLFVQGDPRKMKSVDVLQGGRAALSDANASLVLALSRMRSTTSSRISKSSGAIPTTSNL